MDEITKKVLSVMGDIFGVSVSEIPDDAAPGAIEEWDSLRHMMLLMALEEEFDVRFSDKEMLNMLDVPLIINTISMKYGDKK